MRRVLTTCTPAPRRAPPCLSQSGWTISSRRPRLTSKRLRISPSTLPNSEWGTATSSRRASRVAVYSSLRIRGRAIDAADRRDLLERPPAEQMYSQDIPVAARELPDGMGKRSPERIAAMRLENVQLGVVDGIGQSTFLEAVARRLRAPWLWHTNQRSRSERARKPTGWEHRTRRPNLHANGAQHRRSVLPTPRALERFQGCSARCELARRWGSRSGASAPQGRARHELYSGRGCAARGLARG